MATPSNTDSTINSRDVIRRIEELETLKEDYESEAAMLVDRIASLESDLLVAKAAAAPGEEDALVEHIGDLITDYNDDLSSLYTFDSGDQEELDDLLYLQSQAEGYCDWLHGATLIHGDYWADYVRQYARDIEAISDSIVWPYTHIDWDAAGEELLLDYTTVDFDGETYYVR